MTIPLKKGQVHDIRIEDLAFGGKGVGRVEGFVVLIDGVVPGDLARVRLVKMRGSYAEGRVLQIVEPSPQRIEARCEHFGVCGGCRWQNLPYATQLEYKRSQIVESLRRIGGIEDVTVDVPLASPDQYFYRNKMEFSFGRDSQNQLTLGLHPAASYREVFDLHRCHLQSEQSNVIVDEVREACRGAHLPPYDVNAHTGFLRYLTIREGKFTRQVMVNIVTGDTGSHAAEWKGALRAMASSIVSRHPSIRSFLHSVNSKRATVAIGEREEILHGEAFIREELLGRSFEITSNSFFQTNPRQAERLYGTVLEMAALKPDDRVLDLYAGTGSISILVAAHAREVRGVESVAESVRNAQRNARINKVDNIFFIQGDVRKTLLALASDPHPPTVIIANPPRAGLNESVVRRIVRLRPRRIVYVSCNPTTLARDLHQMCARDYRLHSVQPVDMFPHTFHIECVARIDLSDRIDRPERVDSVTSEVAPAF